MCSNGLERHFFLAPDGSSYSGRKQALEYMKKINSKLEDIKKMESMMQVNNIFNIPQFRTNWSQLFRYFCFFSLILKHFFSFRISFYIS